ncbi:MAG TPA: polynucleotide kinase-phosphatase [Actinomycetota bacterium]
MTELRIPELSLVVLIGASGSGKSTFAARHFLPTEVLSSDRARGMVADDENDQAATGPAFDVVHYVAAKRLGLGRLTVIDATNVQPDSRKPLVALAREHHVLPVAIVLDVPEALAQERNRARPNRQFGPHVVRRQQSMLRRSIGRLEREGFRRVFVLRGPEEIDAAGIVRERAWTDRSDEHGPFDVVGDVHGCSAELHELLARLGYTAGDDGVLAHPEGRVAVFLGDLVDRGPDTPGVLRTVMAMAEAGSAICVPGNHEAKLVRALRGRNVQVTHGLAESLQQLGTESEEFRQRVAEFLDGLVSHYVLDGRRLVVAHAGMREEMQGRASGAVRAFALYGETTGETDEFGLPVRYAWANDYRGAAAVVYGHTPVPEAGWVNGTICVDTGCVFGGSLTALRWPERELVSVPAHRTYYEPAKPFLASGDQAPLAEDRAPGPPDVLDVADVLGRRGIETRLMGRVTIPEENAAAALEVMSRFAIDPRWLVYLPPTMSPVATSERPDLLEHPAEAFSFYRRDGVPVVICEEKHMGSRAVAVVCRTAPAAGRRFGVASGDGAVFTRTGRGFFPDVGMQAEVLGLLREALDAAGLWDELATDWVVLDCEVLPWSLKAEDLLRNQHAAVGAAATHVLAASVDALSAATARGVSADDLLERTSGRLAMAAAFVEAYRPYCWPVASVADVRLAPFQVLAGEGFAFHDREHPWHMAAADRLAAAAPGLIRATANVVVDVTDQSAIDAATGWWEDLVARGGEGMVVKPLQPIVRGSHGVVQPGVKVRGPEYLRIIYGPEYPAPANLARLRQRSLGRKRGLAAREFALGVEALERFARGEPLYRVHECVFGVLALESEPVDPRL